MYEIEVTGINKIQKDLDKLANSLDKDFMQFLGDKFERTLYKTTYENLSTIEDLETSEYAKNHKKQVSKDEIILSNGTMADLSGLSPETLNNYPNGFSIAKAVEYGTGIVGSTSEANGIAESDGWQYDVNGHGEQGWFYKKNGTLYWSKGFEGRLIYYKTAKEIVDNLPKWINNYLNENIK